jgi:threonine/homoserine/homoserine lactone efflux protein
LKKIKYSLLSIFINGVSTGLLLQLAVGPVFFLVMNITTQRTLWDGLCAVLAVTIADYLYITLSIAGVGKLLTRKRAAKIICAGGALVLIIFGGIIIFSKIFNPVIMYERITDGSDYPGSFLSAFFLTLSNPLTILFWTGLFSTKAIEKGYSPGEVLLFGLAAGFATIIFFSTSVFFFTLIKAIIPAVIIYSVNIIIGFILIIYGLIRGIRVLRNKNRSPLIS